MQQRTFTLLSRTARVVAFGFAAIAASFGIEARAGTPGSDGNATSLATGDAAPSFHARSLETGKPIGSADYTGKILVVNFWATWCPPCRAETPEMIRSFRALGRNDVAFLGIDTTEVASVVKTFLSAKGVPYPVALAGPDVYNGFGVSYIPTTIVVDARGIVRARWTGELSEKLLATFVADARAGKSYAIDGPDETIVETLLAPATYDFTGDATAVGTQIARAKANVAAAEAFAGVHASGPAATVDYMRVEGLAGAVLLPAGQNALRVAATDGDRVAADRLIALADGKLNRYADAIAALQAARTIAPTDASLSLDIAKADYRLHDYPDGIAAAAAYTVAQPANSDGWNWLALSNQRAANFADAASAYEKAVKLMRAEVDAAKTPSDRTDAIANVADTSLDLANVYVALGDASGAARAFATSNAYGNRLDSNGPYADLYRNVHERTQEGLIAVHLARDNGKTALSVVPWTGADLPGSLASTLKYRLIVASAPSAKVNLRALGLRAGWVASFCADGLCSPNRVSFTLPQSGVKTYEFQLVPPGSSRTPGAITIRSGDGTNAAVSS